MSLIQAVFIDRDGTIGGSDQVVYPGEFRLFSFVEPAINQLKKSGKLVLSFTNQPGISKGRAKVEDFERELTAFGFDKVYLCPHGHDEGCDYRKPSTGMLLQAAKDYELDLNKCVVIGDRWTDILAGEKVGCRKILVKTGAGIEAIHKYDHHQYYGKWADVSPDYVADNLQHAVNWIMTK